MNNRALVLVVLVALAATACRSEMSFGSPQGCRESQPQTIVVAVPSAQDAPSAVCPVVPAPVVATPAAPAAPSFWEKTESDVGDSLKSSDPDGTERSHTERVKKTRIEGDPRLNPDAKADSGMNPADRRLLAEAVERLRQQQAQVAAYQQAAMAAPSVIPNPGPPPRGHMYKNGTIVPCRR